MRVNAPHRLWQDTAIYRRRYEKSAAALVATARALARNRPLGSREAEFLRLYAMASDADPRVFTAVWRDPTAYFWVRMAYQLTATCLTGSPLPPLAREYCAEHRTTRPDVALAAHLDGFKRFVLALRVAARGSVRFARPLDARLPFAIPATPLSLVGRGAIRIRSLRGGRLEVGHRGRTVRVDLDGVGTSALGVARCPVLDTGGVRVELQPHALNVPGLSFARDAARVSLDFQATHAGLVGEALSLMRRHHAPAHAHFGRMMRLVTLKPLGLGGYTNLSHSDLPGAAICGVVADAYEMADTLVHELHHNRFFFIEEAGPFFRDATGAVLQNGYYSPWRDDLRPLHGLFHGLYVYLPVARFWLAVYRSRETDEPRRSYVVDRILRIARQVRIAATVLGRHAELTPLGAALFAGMRADVDAIQDAVRTLGLPADAPAVKVEADGSFAAERDPSSGRALSVEDAVTAHIASHDVHRQCEIG